MGRARRRQLPIKRTRNEYELVRASRENRFAVYLITALLFGAGMWAVFQLPSNIYPEVNFPRIMILVHSGDLPPDTQLISVTRPLEQAAMGFRGFTE